jgi:hypothetical protein
MHYQMCMACRCASCNDCPASLLHVLGVQKGCKSVVVTLLRALPKLLHGNCVLQWRNVAAAASCKEIVCVSGQSWLLVSCCSACMEVACYSV